MYPFVKLYRGKILGLEAPLLRKGILKNFPILNSVVPLNPRASKEELLLDLMNSLFTSEVFDSIEQRKLEECLNSVKEKSAEDFLGKKGDSALQGLVGTKDSGTLMKTDVYHPKATLQIIILFMRLLL